MDASSTQRLIKKMLDSRELMPETREELEEHLAELEKGALHADDARYIEGLARRLGFAEGGAPEAGSSGGAASDDDDGGSFVGNERAADTAAAVQVEMALRKVEQAQALVARLRETPAAGSPADGGTAGETTATLTELDTVLNEAAKALRRDH